MVVAVRHSSLVSNMETKYFSPSCAHTARRKGSCSEFPMFENALGIYNVENHSWLFPSLPDAGGVPELACLCVPTLLGYHILSQVASPGSAPALAFFPGPRSTLEAGLLPPRQPQPPPSSWVCPEPEPGCLWEQERLYYGEGRERLLSALGKGSELW